MNEELFRLAMTAIDGALDGWIGKPAGITVGYALARGLYGRGLLETVEQEIDGVNWQHRRYRGRIVQPDPQLAEYDFYFGMRVG